MTSVTSCTFKSVLIVGISTLLSCGGGSGGAGPSPNPPTPPDNSTNDTLAPTVSVQFPTLRSITHTPRINVRGTAVDDSDITSVSINGVQAQTDDNFAQWHAEIELQNGENVVYIETRDAAGNVNHQAAKLWINHLPPMTHPDAITIDDANNYAFVASNGTSAILSVDILTGQRNILSDSSIGSGDPFDTIRSLVFDEDRKKLFVVTDNINGAIVIDAPYEVKFISVDVITGDRTVIKSYPFIGGGTSFLPRSLHIDPIHNRALALDISGKTISALDLNTGEVSTVVDLNPNNTIMHLWAMHVNDLNTQATFSESPSGTIYTVDLNTGEKTAISSDTVGSGETLRTPTLLSVNSETNIAVAYDSPRQSLIHIDLTNGNRSILASTDTTPNFYPPSALTLDIQGKKVLLASDQYPGVFAIDITQPSTAATGTRPISVFRTNSENQTVDRAVNARRINETHYLSLYDPIDNTLFKVGMNDASVEIIAQYPENTDTDFAEVDLDNDRIYTYDAGVFRTTDTQHNVIAEHNLSGIFGFLSQPGAFTFDAINQRIVFMQSRSLRAFDVTSQAELTLVQSAFTDEDGVYTLDPLNHRAFIVNDPTLTRPFLDGPGPSSLYALDLNTGNRTLISDSEEGEGPTIGRVSDLAHDAQNSQVFVCDISHNRITAIDLASGRRHILADGDSVGDPLFSPRKIWIDTSNRRLILGESFHRSFSTLDLDSGQRVTSFR